MASVQLEKVRKVFEGGVTAVHGIDLEVKDKEFVVLVGPSGCGKSTTLRMIAGLEEVTEGKVFIDGRLVNDVAPKDRDIAMVFQNYALYPHMTVYENMAFGLKLRKTPKREIDHRVREAAALLGIEGLLGRKPKALSGGQRQRVAVGRAIVRKPKVFLFDEPLSNLDAKLRVQMRTEISKLHQRLGATMIYVTHDQTEAMTMADKIVLLKDGFVQQIASPMDIYEHPINIFVAGFIGSPAMNFLQGSIHRSRGLWFQSEGGGRLKIPKSGERALNRLAGKPISLGVRPEHIAIPARGLKSGIGLSARIEVVEPMGNEFFVYVSVVGGGANWVGRIGTARVPEIGKRIDLDVDMSKAHFFDPMTDEAIC